MLRRYVPPTTINVPKNFVKVGISRNAIVAISVVNTGLKAEIGDIREIGECLIAQIDARNATTSIALEIRVKAKNFKVTCGIPPERKRIPSIKGRINMLLIKRSDTVSTRCVNRFTIDVDTEDQRAKYNERKNHIKTV